MADTSFPLMPTPAGGPAAPIEGATNSAPTADQHPYEGGIADTFKTDYTSSPVVTALARGVGEITNPTPISHDDAAKMLTMQGLDPSFLAKDGNTVGAVQAEAERQSEIKLHQLRQDRQGNNWGSSPITQLGGMISAGAVDPSNLVLGPAAGVLGKLVAEAPLAAKLVVGAGEATAYNTGFTVAGALENGKDPDLASWEFLRNTTFMAVTGGLLHAAFGPRAIVSKGADMRGDTGLNVINTLERSDAAAKVQGVSADEVVSPTGAVGRYQVEPGTARGLGLKGTDEEITEQLKDPAVNKDTATKLLDQLARRYGNDPEAIAVAYNAGPARADKWIANGRDDRVLPGETRGYLGRLRGTPMGDRTSAGAIALKQFEADNEVDPNTIYTHRSALTLGDDHNAQVRSLETEAWYRAQPDQLRYDPTEADADGLMRIRSEAEQTTAATAETENPTKDYVDQAEMIRPGAGESVKNAVAETSNEHEEGTQLTHDELTKAVQSAVTCGVTKGVSYGAE